MSKASEWRESVRVANEANATADAERDRIFRRQPTYPPSAIFNALARVNKEGGVSIGGDCPDPLALARWLVETFSDDPAGWLIETLEAHGEAHGLVFTILTRRP